MAYEYITKYTSPTYTPAAQVPNVYGQARKVKSITIHWWGAYGQKFQNVVDFLCSSAPTSAHYVVEAGKVACIVDPENAAWHSGNPTGNATSIGIECRPEATDGDYATTAELIRELRAVYGDIPLVPHRDWFNTACPGKWDLKRLDKLARQGAAKPAATKPKPAPKPKPKPKAKTVSQLADEVIAGKHGAGDARKRALGNQYNAVQAEVNRKLLGTKPKQKTISQLADEVIAGKHGNGPQRQRSLGNRYAAVQAEVNRKLS